MANITNRLVTVLSLCRTGAAATRWLVWLVPIAVIVSGWVLAPAVHADATAISVSLSPTSIVANGISTTVATATVTDAIPPATGDTVAFKSTDTVETITPTACVPVTPGTYCATIKSSTTIGTPTITATVTSGTTTLSANATLTQTAGPAATVTVQLGSSSIVANGTSTTTATATVTDAQGHPVSNETGVVFSSSDPNVRFTPNPAAPGTTPGTYSTTITSSTTPGNPTIVATDGAIGSTPQVLMQTGPAARASLQLTPSTILADGSSTTTATATVMDAAGHLLSGETGIVFSSTDSAEPITPTACVPATPGTYCATIKSSTAVGTPTITVKDGAASASQSLNQTAGMPAIVTVHLNPNSIAADGSSQTEVTATVTDLQHHPISTDTVVFSSSDPGQFFGSVLNHGNGTYSVEIRSSTTPGPATITARDANGVTGQATLGQTAGASSTTLVASTSTLVTNETVTLFASVGAPFGSPSGTITFRNGVAPIAHCIGLLVTPVRAAATCQTSFGASSATKQISAVFTPDAISTAPGSIGAITLTVRPDATSVSLGAPTTVGLGQRTTYTAVIRPATGLGPVIPTGWVRFLDGGSPITACGASGLINGRATCKLAYKARGVHRITAQYGGDPNFGGSSSAASTIRVVPVLVPVLGVLTPTMQWTFHYTPGYTSIVALSLYGTSTSARVAVVCKGRGCPFGSRTMSVAKPKRCGQKGQRSCPTSGSIDLARPFRGRRLYVGAKLTVVISRPNWIGKYYGFTILPRSGPRIQVACVGPGHNQPGVGCST